MLEVNSCDQQMKVENRQLVEMKEAHLRELREIEVEAESRRKKLQEQIETL